MDDVVIKIEGLRKKYRLGSIGGGTLKADLQSWVAKMQGKEDPNLKIGENYKSDSDIFYALDDINLEVKKGEALGIIGVNGAGKSTLLKILSRVTAPTEGEIKVKGRISSMLEVGTGFHAELTGRENIYMNGAILGMTKREVDTKMEDIIDFSECRQFIDTPVKRYSSGMYVKLAFAVAAHLDAEIMVMDEVLAVGDVKFQKKCLGKMGDASTNEGKTVLYVSHNMSTIRQLCTRCLVLRKGQIVYDGDVEGAIDVYMEQEKGELSTEYYLEETKRPSFDHGMQLKINRFGFLNKEEARFSDDERMMFEIEVESSIVVEGLGFYFILLYADSTTVGTAQTLELSTVEAGEKKKFYYEFDISNLAEGRYYFQIDAYIANEYGSFSSLDHPLKNIFFEKVCSINKPNNITWQRPYFGSVKLHTIEKMKVNKNEQEKNTD